jgi:hypothetical protein
VPAPHSGVKLSGGSLKTRSSKQAEEEAKTGHRVFELRTTRSILFCNRKQKLVHFACIQFQQRFLKLQADHSAQLTATPLLLLVNN